MPFSIRDATSSDIPALAALHVRTFNETHRGGRPGGPSYALRLEQWQDAFDVTDGTWFCVLIEDDQDEIVGFAKGVPHDGGVAGFAGELDKIYLLQTVQRQGLGRLLLLTAAERFLVRGVTSMLLFGDASNPSNGFYEAFGAERLYAESGEFNGGYGWRDLRRLVGAMRPSDSGAA